MAKVTVQVLGAEGATVLEDVYSVEDVLDAMDTPNHSATVNGDSADADTELFDRDFIDLAPSVKGGC